MLTTASAQFLQGGGKLTGNDAIGQSLQGSAVALSANGTTAAVGGRGDLNLGAFAGSTWVCTRGGLVGSTRSETGRQRGGGALRGARIFR